MILASSIFLAESALKIFYKFAVQGLENIPLTDTTGILSITVFTK